METVFASWAEISVTENHIKQLHRDLLRYSDKDERHRGSYKTASNSVTAFDADGNPIGVVFETASPFETPRLMAELVDWFRQAQQGALHPLIVIGIFIVVFLEIPPFQDGNGRLSRVLTTLLLLRAGYAYVPYSSLERFIEQSVIEQSKEGYYLALRRTQGTIRTEAPDWTPWLSFFLKALQRQMRRLRGKVERERLLLAKLPDLAIQILDHARDHGRVTIADAVAITGASRNTLKLHFKTLRERGLLALHGQGRGAWYSLS
jgi:Fic family protein